MFYVKSQLRSFKREDLLGRPNVEASYNVSTAALLVVRGDKQGSQRPGM